MGSVAVNLVDGSSSFSHKHSRLLGQHFDDGPCVAWVYDLASYPRELSESPGAKHNGAAAPWSMLEETLCSFSGFVSSKLWDGKTILLWLINITSFRQLLEHFPFHERFPDYRDGGDDKAALEYIIQKFQERADGKAIYVHICDLTDAENMKFLYSAVKDTMLERALQDTGISEA
jgi:hypothetical protein